MANKEGIGSLISDTNPNDLLCWLVTRRKYRSVSVAAVESGCAPYFEEQEAPIFSPLSLLPPRHYSITTLPSSIAPLPPSPPPCTSSFGRSQSCLSNTLRWNLRSKFGRDLGPDHPLQHRGARAFASTRFCRTMCIQLEDIKTHQNHQPPSWVSSFSKPPIKSVKLKPLWCRKSSPWPAPRVQDRCAGVVDLPAGKQTRNVFAFIRRSIDFHLCLDRCEAFAFGAVTNLASIELALHGWITITRAKINSKWRHKSDIPCQPPCCPVNVRTCIQDPVMKIILDFYKLYSHYIALVHIRLIFWTLHLKKLSF